MQRPHLTKPEQALIKRLIIEGHNRAGVNRILSEKGFLPVGRVTFNEYRRSPEVQADIATFEQESRRRGMESRFRLICFMDRRIEKMGKEIKAGGLGNIDSWLKKVEKERRWIHLLVSLTNVPASPEIDFDTEELEATREEVFKEMEAAGLLLPDLLPQREEEDAEAG